MGKKRNKKKQHQKEEDTWTMGHLLLIVAAGYVAFYVLAAERPTSLLEFLGGVLKFLYII